MSDPNDLRNTFVLRCDTIEEAYEFMLAYAAQGLTGDAAWPSVVSQTNLQPSAVTLRLASDTVLSTIVNNPTVTGIGGTRALEQAVQSIATPHEREDEPSGHKGEEGVRTLDLLLEQGDLSARLPLWAVAAESLNLASQL